MYIVALNGPPQCGKDTLAKMLVEILDSKTDLPVKIDHLALPLRKIAYKMAGLETFDLPYEEFKNTLFPQFGVTGRRLMIDASEKFLKPTYGKEIMAKILLDRNVGFDGILILADCGFQCEINPLAAFAGGENLVVFNVHRRGKTFEGDSREWVNHTFQSSLYNDGTYEELRVEAQRAYSRMVNQLHWRL